VGDGTAAFLWMSADNGEPAGTRGFLDASECIEVGRRCKVPVLVAAGRCPWTDLAAFGVPPMAVVPELVRTGAAVVVSRGDGLFGGPGCGMVLGESRWIAAAREHSLALPLAPDRLVQAALMATLRLYRRPEQLRDAIPLMQVLAVSGENLRQRAARLAPQAAASAAVAEVEVVPLAADFPAGHRRQPSWGIAVRPRTMSLDQLASALGRGQPPLVAELEDDRLIIDLRTVLPRQDMDLIEAFASLAPREAAPAQASTPADPSAPDDETT
jgi:L-seryl-tRNA(Ser) seleniumtransferase